MNEKDTNWFRPLWIRIAVTAVCVGWFAWEVLYTHDQLFMALAAAAIGYCVWNLFLKFPKTPNTTPTSTPDQTPPNS